MAESIIRFENVTYSYPGTEIPAIKDINLDIREGEIVLITGPSGAGKTTLCSTLNRIVPESYEGEMTGKIFVQGEDISPTPSARWPSRRVCCSRIPVDMFGDSLINLGRP